MVQTFQLRPPEIIKFDARGFASENGWRRRLRRRLVRGGVPVRFRLRIAHHQNPPHPAATTVVRKCGTSTVPKNGFYTQCPSVLGVQILITPHIRVFAESILEVISQKSHKKNVACDRKRVVR